MNRTCRTMLTVMLWLALPVLIGGGSGMWERSMAQEGLRATSSHLAPAAQERGNDNVVLGDHSRGRRDPFQSLLDRRSRPIRAAKAPVAQPGSRTREWMVVGIMIVNPARKQAVLRLDNGQHVVLAPDQYVGSSSWKVTMMTHEALIVERSDGRRMMLPVGKAIRLSP